MLLEEKIEYKVKVIANNQIVLDSELYVNPVLQNNQVRGRTLVSLISPGTELAVFKNSSGQFSFPTGLGYACVFQIEEIGSNVITLKVGDKVFLVVVTNLFRLQMNKML
jgi:NADPH:quinone reductase-like Zn-dependent oxidoreductase